ncbi:hypothetical protein OPQ81_001311 [Rhizoctonia solani]|nr:hypothetical protein OPQ81_001311 [Rhizoctonia solani]
MYTGHYPTPGPAILSPRDVGSSPPLCSFISILFSSGIYIFIYCVRSLILYELELVFFYQRYPLETIYYSLEDVAQLPSCQQHGVPNSSRQAAPLPQQQPFSNNL